MYRAIHKQFKNALQSDQQIRTMYNAHDGWADALDIAIVGDVHIYHKFALKVIQPLRKHRFHFIVPQPWKLAKKFNYR